MVQRYANQEVSYLVIGAGMAGLAAAQSLQSAGFRVQVVDKGRGVGGRMATRRMAGGVLDHGAQYFSVRDPRFQKFVTQWEADGVVKAWADGFPTAEGDLKRAGSPRYRGATGMTAVAKALAAGLDIHLGTRIEAVGVEGRLWHARTVSGEVFQGSGLIMTPPVPQALALLKAGNFDLPQYLAGDLQGLGYHPCIALLVVLEEPSRVPAPGGVRVRKGAIRWIADNHLKGISPGAAAVTLHASPDFSRQAWELDDDEISRRLLAEASPWVKAPVHTYQVHRWRFAQPITSYPEPFSVLAGPPPLLFAGDAFGGGRVEGAALSGLQAAEWLIRSET